MLSNHQQHHRFEAGRYVAYEQEEDENTTNGWKPNMGQLLCPLLVLTVSLAFLPLLPHTVLPAAAAILSSLWAILFVATPIIYLCYYDPTGESTCQG